MRASLRAQFRGCPRNCKRRACSRIEPLGPRPWEGAQTARTREPGDRPLTSSSSRRRWDGRRGIWSDQNTRRRRALAAFSLRGAADARSRPSRRREQLGEITVTADRIPEPSTSVGSDVTVIPGSEVEQWGANGITQALQEVVGVNVDPTGGPSTATSVYLRGADPGRSSS